MPLSDPKITNSHRSNQKLYQVFKKLTSTLAIKYAKLWTRTSKWFIWAERGSYTELLWKVTSWLSKVLKNDIWLKRRGQNVCYPSTSCQLATSRGVWILHSMRSMLISWLLFFYFNIANGWYIWKTWEFIITFIFEKLWGCRG